MTYAKGIGLVQVFWLALLLIEPGNALVFYGLFLVGGMLELAVPAIAERQGETSWHRHHIIERYGLLNIIVLGESLLAAVIALQTAMGDHFNVALVHIALSALIITFMMWWLYFTRENHLETQDLRRSLIWGYGHSVIFASGAAVGACFAVLVDVITDHAKVSLLVGDYAVAIPLAFYLVALWAVRDRYCLAGLGRFALPIFAVLILLVPFTPIAPEGIAGLMVLCVVARSFAARASSITA